MTAVKSKPFGWANQQQLRCRLRPDYSDKYIVNKHNVWNPFTIFSNILSKGCYNYNLTMCTGCITCSVLQSVVLVHSFVSATDLQSLQWTEKNPQTNGYPYVKPCYKSSNILSNRENYNIANYICIYRNYMNNDHFHIVYFKRRLIQYTCKYFKQIQTNKVHVPVWSDIGNKINLTIVKSLSTLSCSVIFILINQKATSI